MEPSKPAFFYALFHLTIRPFFPLCILLLAFCFMGFLVSSTEGASMDRLFQGRDWKGIDGILDSASRDVTVLSSKDLSLGINALWMQKRYAQAMELLELGQNNFPEEIQPYATMFRILGYERTGRPKEAVKEALRFWKSPPPEFLKYYVAYAIARCAEDQKDNQTARRWYARMVKLGETKGYRQNPLSKLLTLPGTSFEDASAMLDDYPLNQKALHILEKQENPGATTLTYLGYAAYARGNYEKGEKLFARAIAKGAKGRAEYYRGHTLYKLKRYEESMEQWYVLASRGASYSASSTRRIGICAYRGVQNEAVKLLKKLVDEKSGAVKETALYYLMVIADELGPPKEYPLWRDALRKDFPSGKYGVQSYWNGAWDAWKKGNMERAANELSRGLPHTTGSAWPPRFLYWIARTQDVLKRPDKAKKFRQQLGELYPLSYYTFLIFPQGSKPIRETLPKVLQSSPTILEEWGFLQYARLSLAKSSKAALRLRAARMAMENGDVRSAYILAHTFSGIVRGLDYLPLEVLELLYPRAYKDHVEKAAEKFHVPSSLLWAVMRQESGYDPGATSYVGAMGLMQLMPATARGLAKQLKVQPSSFYDVAHNITLGSHYIASRVNKFKSLPKAAAAYNAGAGAVAKWKGRGNDEEEWIEDIPYLETNDYVRRVMGNYGVYEMLERYRTRTPSLAPAGKDSSPDISVSELGERFLEEIRENISQDVQE